MFRCFLYHCVCWPFKWFRCLISQRLRIISVVRFYYDRSASARKLLNTKICLFLVCVWPRHVGRLSQLWVGCHITFQLDLDCMDNFNGSWWNLDQRDSGKFCIVVIDSVLWKYYVLYSMVSAQVEVRDGWVGFTLLCWRAVKHQTNKQLFLSWLNSAFNKSVNSFHSSPFFTFTN